MTVRTDQTPRSALAPVLEDALSAVDAALSERLRAVSADEDYWTFRRSTGATHGQEVLRYYQYPAMMVPEMQRALIEAVVACQPGVKRLLDPYAGSGTVLAEGLLAGLDVVGLDINPLSVLLCQTKAGPFCPATLRERCLAVLERAQAATDTPPAVSFPNQDKWFRPQATVELSRLRHAIMAEPQLWIRRFLWVTLAETVRLTSNSRTSTYKLHVRPAEELESAPLPLATFERVLAENLARHEKFAASLAAAGRLDASGQPIPQVESRLGDAREPIAGAYDLSVTSPPYGDNPSTVPYGQSSYLALRWIPLGDIDSTAPPALIGNTHAIDTASIGGRRTRGDLQELTNGLRERSPSFAHAVQALQSLPRDRLSRLFAYVRDLEATLSPIADAMRDNAYLIWTVGNRCIGGYRVPLDEILIELFAAYDVVPVERVHRRIPTKRMASRNALAATMRAETAVVLRRGSVG